MKSVFFALATLAIGIATSPAEAAKKSAKSGSSHKTAVIDCMRQYGAWYDTATKRWTMRGPYHHMASRADAVDRCVAQKTGQPMRAVMQERTVRY